MSGSEVRGATATDPDGIVHDLQGAGTRCGRNASGWSREVTELQRLGLVAHCGECSTEAALARADHERESLASEEGE